MRSLKNTIGMWGSIVIGYVAYVNQQPKWIIATAVAFGMMYLIGASVTHRDCDCGCEECEI